LSELTKRIVSGVLLAAVLLGDLWLGSWWYLGLLLIGGALVLREFVRLVWGMTSNSDLRALWVVFGVTYVGLALFGLWRVREIETYGLIWALWLFLVVWATDVGAYVFGRTIGGPKIAPKISPSKTWAGLLGGTVMVAVVMNVMFYGFLTNYSPKISGIISVGFVWGGPLAFLAQAGDFFESWMKRRAGVKDSGSLIPGHGGLFDRVDGLLPVAIVFPWWMGLA
jgi:phosphatidate cytidylyltransferase